jgi:hypothetical protein
VGQTHLIADGDVRRAAVSRRPDEPDEEERHLEGGVHRRAAHERGSDVSSRSFDRSNGSEPDGPPSAETPRVLRRHDSGGGVTDHQERELQDEAKHEEQRGHEVEICKDLVPDPVTRLRSRVVPALMSLRHSP